MDWWVTTDSYYRAVMAPGSRFIDLDGRDRGPVEERQRAHAETVLWGRQRSGMLEEARHEADVETRRAALTRFMAEQAVRKRA